MQGEDVKLLQNELRQLGWNIPEWETEEGLIYNDQVGVSTRRWKNDFYSMSTTYSSLYETQVPL